MAECFACGARILNINVPCPKCGYIFDTDTNKVCPNRKVTVCNITGKICSITGTGFGKCPVKNEADRGAEY